MKKLIKMYNEKYGDTLGVIDDDFNKEQMYRIYYFIKNNCDDKEIQERLAKIKLDKPKTLEQQLTKLESENGNINVKKYIDDNTIIHPLPIYKKSESSSMIMYMVNILDLKKLTTYGAIRDMDSTKYQQYRFIYPCDNGKNKTIVSTADDINDTTFRISHYNNTSTLSFNNINYNIDYTKHSTPTDVIVTESIQKYLGIYNTHEYTPTNDYHPATKKYVDDNRDYYFKVPTILYDDSNLPKGYVDITTLEQGTNYKVNSSIVSGFFKVSLKAPNDDGTWFTVDDGSNTIGWSSMLSTSICVQLKSDTFIAINMNCINNYCKYLSITKENGKWKLMQTKLDSISPDNTYKYDVTNDYNPAHKKYVDDKVSSLPQISFNETGELVVTINGVSKTFVPKSE